MPRNVTIVTALIDCQCDCVYIVLTNIRCLHENLLLSHTMRYIKVYMHELFLLDIYREPFLRM